MATDNVTSINATRRQEPPPGFGLPIAAAIAGSPPKGRKSKRSQRRATLPPQVVERLREARDLVFQAQSIAEVAAAAAVAETPADEHSTETTLRLAAEILDKVAGLIEPGYLARAAADAEVRQ